MLLALMANCTENAGFLQGLKVAEARATVIEKLRENNLLVRQKAITHSVNVHERCKKEIEYIILPQWFISILTVQTKIFRNGRPDQLVPIIHEISLQ